MPSEQEVQKYKYKEYILELTEKEKQKYPDFKYRTIQDYTFFYRGKEIYIPKGFLTDGPSLPEPYHSYFLKAFFEQWLIHDYVYAVHKICPNVPRTRLRADKYVLNTLKPIWTAVYIFGASFFNMYRFFHGEKWADEILDEAWEESGNRGAVYYEDNKYKHEGRCKKHEGRCKRHERRCKKHEGRCKRHEGRCKKHEFKYETSI